MFQKRSESSDYINNNFDIKSSLNSRSLIDLSSVKPPKSNERYLKFQNNVRNTLETSGNSVEIGNENKTLLKIKDNYSSATLESKNPPFVKKFQV